LREKKKALFVSNKNIDEAVSSSNDASAATDDVQAMLERGRTLLAEAEAHSEILGQYASSGKSWKSDDGMA